MRVIGLTGGIGSGKSTVSKYLREKGYVILDADEMAKAMTEKPGVLDKIKTLFGSSVFDETGCLDRKALGTLVFNNEKALKQLNELIHSTLYAETERLIKEYAIRGEDHVVIDAPLLIEAGFTALVDEVWVVDADDELRIKRLLEREDHPRAYYEKVMANQLPREKRNEKATLVLNNNGDVGQLYEQIEKNIKMKGRY